MLRPSAVRSTRLASVSISISVSVSISISALLGCGAPADAPDVEATCFELPQPMLAANGVNLQGLSLNGIGLNGIGLNGIGLNGIGLNGISLNGISLNGVGLNGVGLNGVGLNGVGLNGSNLNGVWQNGIWENGIWENGIWENGNWSNGREADAALGAIEGLAVRLDGGRLVVEREGERLPDEALLGATFSAGEGKAKVELRIYGVTVDESDDRLARYELGFVGGGAVCAEGFEEGVFVAGWFDDAGRYHPDASGRVMSYACANGVMSKCLTWGYKPWTTSADAYQTCTRLARADYCGDGVPWTQNGTAIDVYDGFGVQERAGGFTFEAGWSVDGAVCVSSPRYDVFDASGDAIRPGCWDSLPRCGSFEEAEDLGALIGNDSGHTSLQACER